MNRIDLSCDLGEAANESERLVELAIWPMISSANVACGGHAGDDETMREAVELSLRYNVTLGAHPSYPDREGFGRRSLEIAADALRGVLADQLARIRAIAAARGVRLARVKPHGALYNDAHHDGALAETISRAVHEAAPDAALVCSPGSGLVAAAHRAGLGVILEAFADRRYRSNGSLVPRSDPRALLLEPAEAAAQALGLANESRVVADNGMDVRVTFETLCIHADMPRSPERLAEIRRVLAAHGYLD